MNGFLLYNLIAMKTFQCSNILFDEYTFDIFELKERIKNKKTPHPIFEKTRILKIKFGSIFFGSNPVFKGVVSNFLMVVKVVILCFFFRYQMHKPSTHNSKSIFIFQRLCFQM